LHDERNDDALLLAAGCGEQRAFRTLMNRHATAALGLARRRLGGTADADDIVQEAFLRVWRTAPRWCADGEARFATWLYRVVTNLCLDRLRQPRTWSLDSAAGIEAPVSNGYDRAQARGNRHRVEEAMAALTPRQRAAITLYHFAEMRSPEAARALGVSLSALESLLVRGRRTLRRELHRLGIDRFEDIL
jgi:RNA polymerase sigma-70 factor (ECF subfamily)